MNTRDLAPARPEVLAPAGDMEAVRAACANGADAVYFGLSAFNARARAANFTLEELPDLMKFLHARNVRGFVALNTLIFTDELAEAERFVRAIAAAAVDAVIVQDLGLVTLVRRVAPTLAVHGSTQMTLTEPRGINVVKALGVSRVVLARELSIDDIRTVTAGTDVPVEVFAHGALCVAYSGQCLTSEALGGRSANRGQCAQACRLPYEMIVDGRERDLGDRAYLLSPQDLAAYEHIGSLVDAGVVSFKIEGRLKGGPYVAATTQTYRKAVDAAVAGKPFRPSRREELDLAQTFSRGLTAGFLTGINHQKLVRGRVPKSRGVKLGVVAAVGQSIRVKLTEALPSAELIAPGDGVLFDLGTPGEQEPGGSVWTVKHLPGRVVELGFATDAFDPKRVPVGCEVWKTADPALTKRLEQTYSRDLPARRLPVEAVLTGVVGGELSLVLTTPDGRRAEATWAGPLEAASKRPTTGDEVREQLGRLGDTAFELAGVELDLSPGVLIPRSVLNDLRRRAAAGLADPRPHAVAAENALASLRAEAKVAAPDERSPALTVLVRTAEQFAAVLEWVPPEGFPRPAAVYCDFEDVRRYKDAVVQARAAGVPVGLAPPRVWKPGEDGFNSVVARSAPDAVLVRNLAGIGYYQNALPEAELIGDFSLNVSNELTAGVLFNLGLHRLVPSFDLNWEQFAALLKASVAARFEPVIHQHMPMFHTEHCVFAAFLSTGKDHRDCGRPCDTHKVELRDRVGANFPVTADAGCRNTVFNSVPQSAAEYAGRMRDLGARLFRVDLLRESASETRDLLNSYAAVIAGRDDGRKTWKAMRAVNQLGVTRGTLNMA